MFNVSKAILSETQATEAGPSTVKSNFPTDAQLPAKKPGTALDLATKVEFNTEVVEAGSKLIVRSAKAEGSLTRDIFNLIRKCSDLHLAEGTFKVAESRALDELNKPLKEKGEKPFNTLNEYAQSLSLNQLSYSVIKSGLLGIARKADEYFNTLQDWYNWQEKYEHEPARIVQEGFLNPWSAMYADEQKGSTLFMRHKREVDNAAKQLIAAKNRKAREDKAKEAEAKPGETRQEPTTTQAKAGVRQAGNLPQATQEALNTLIKVVMDCNVIIGDIVLQELNACAERIRVAARQKHASMEQASKEHASRPSQAAADASKAQEEMAKPDYVSQEDWDEDGTPEARQWFIDNKEEYLKLKQEESGKEIRPDVDQEAEARAKAFATRVEEGQSVQAMPDVPQSFLKPEWYTDADWDELTPEMQLSYITDGQEKYEEEKRWIEENAPDDEKPQASNKVAG